MKLGVLVSAANRKYPDAYVANTGTGGVGGCVWAYKIDPTTGALTTIAGNPFAAGVAPVSIALDPVGKYAYVAYNAGGVSAFTIDSATGALTPVVGNRHATGTTPYCVATDSSGKFVYVANWNSGDISAYTINAASGSLTPLGGSPFAVGIHPRFVRIMGLQ